MLNVDHVDVHLEWVIPDLLHLTGMKTTESFSQAAYLRLLIPELLPDIDRTIYLDSDLVVERDLGESSEIERVTFLRSPCGITCTRACHA